LKRAIGGEFELNDLQKVINSFDLTQNISGSWTVSGRAALYALLKPLKQQGLSKILLPAYLCESILQPVKECGLAYEYYPVDENLAAQPDPQKGSAVLLIHYFGWLNPSTKLLREEARDSFTLIEDMTQSVFSPWNLENGTQSNLFFSLRKFGPVPLGGWYNQVEDLPDTGMEFKALLWKSIAARLIKYNCRNFEAKSTDQAEQTYLELFESVENSFDSPCTPYNLDDEARQLIHAVDWENASASRRQNWKNLDILINNTLQPFHESLDGGVVPLGYVVRCTDREKLRRSLIEARIFCPVHWKLPDDVDARFFPISKNLSNSLLTIPIDQRYGSDDMEYIQDVTKRCGYV
jgi:hypothetical protein